MPHFDHLSDWAGFLDQAVPAGSPGLSRMTAMLSALGIRQPEVPVITVAGTNGKGSYVHALSMLLIDEGFQVGSYTSPHFFSYNERIALNGEPVDDRSFLLALNRVGMKAEELSLELFFFEMLTLACFVIFSDYKPDYWILEVGMGGRLDPVNSLSPDIAVITSIGLDHRQFLGNTREAIATEKCGILRDESRLLILEPDPLPALIEAKASRKTLSVGKDFSVNGREDGWWLMDHLSHNRETALGNPEQSPLALSGAIMTARHFLQVPIADDRLNTLLSRPGLPGRFECLASPRGRFILDVMHNPAAARWLHEKLQRRSKLSLQRRLAVFALMGDKDLPGIVAALSGDFDAWFVTELAHPASAAGSEIAKVLHEQGIHMISVSKNARQAFARAMSLAAPTDEIVVFGSFRLIADLYPKVRKLTDQ